MVRLLDRRAHRGRAHHRRHAPLERLPLYVRAGSIFPWARTKNGPREAGDPIELRVYRGADGDFTLYEDENDNYDYEKGAYATIPFIGTTPRPSPSAIAKASSLGCLRAAAFSVVFVGENHGVGIDSADEPDKVVQYSGKQITVTP